jgi:hypothetical protein
VSHQPRWHHHSFGLNPAIIPYGTAALNIGGLSGATPTIADFITGLAY